MQKQIFTIQNIKYFLYKNQKFIETEITNRYLSNYLL